MMRLSGQVRPISQLKADAAGILAQLAERGEPVVITQNGEAKAVLQNLASYEATQETLAMLKLLALGAKDMASGDTRDARDVIASLRER